MAMSRVVAERHRAGNQVLNRLLQHFRHELASGDDDADAEFADIRPAHVHIIGNIGRKGVRLTELAERAQLSLATCSELVSDLQTLGYVERRADPSDGRAKLIFPTTRGGELLNTAGRRVAAIEQEWGELVGAEDFEAALLTLDQLLMLLDDRRRGVARPADP